MEMFKKFIQNFNKLPLSNKSMVYLMWIYWVWQLIVNIFINIYIYKINKSLESVIFYNIFFYTFCLIWFSWIWYFMSVFRKDIINMYYISYISFILSFILLFLLNNSIYWIYLFWTIYWFWTWAFWCAVHTQELKNITNKNRDFYSSSIWIWNNLISVIFPILIAFTFYLSGFYNFNAYLIIFFILPFFYIISFIFIKNIDSYIPSSINNKDFTNFFNLSKYKYWHLYFLFNWLDQWIATVILSIIGFILLKTEINIWVFNSVLTLFSIFILIHFSHKRQEKNRLKYFFILSIIISILYIMFWMFFWLITYIIFSLILIFIRPMFRVSEHVYDLAMMDNIKVWDSDFYPAMLFREILLWIGRMLWFFILILIYYYFWLETIDILRLWLLLIGIFVLISYLFIFLWEKYEKNNF